jgi:hypothetical protein
MVDSVVAVAAGFWPVVVVVDTPVVVAAAAFILMGAVVVDRTPRHPSLALFSTRPTVGTDL